MGSGLAPGKAKGSGPFGGGGAGGGAAGGFAAAGGRQSPDARHSLHFGLSDSFFMIIEIRDLHSVATYPLQHECITNNTPSFTHIQLCASTSYFLAPNGTQWNAGRAQRISSTHSHEPRPLALRLLSVRWRPCRGSLFLHKEAGLRGMFCPMFVRAWKVGQ